MVSVSERARYSLLPDGRAREVLAQHAPTTEPHAPAMEPEGRPVVTNKAYEAQMERQARRENVLAYLQGQTTPKSRSEICEALDLSTQQVAQALAQLRESRQIREITDGPVPLYTMPDQEEVAPVAVPASAVEPEEVLAPPTPVVALQSVAAAVAPERPLAASEPEPERLVIRYGPWDVELVIHHSPSEERANALSRAVGLAVFGKE